MFFHIHLASNHVVESDQKRYCLTLSQDIIIQDIKYIASHGHVMYMYIYATTRNIHLDVIYYRQ